MDDLAENEEVYRIPVPPFRITETLHFADNVHIEVQNDSDRFAWRLVVGDPDTETAERSEWTTHYPGLLEFKGYFVSTAYWEGILPVFVPFKITEIQKR